MCYSLKAQNVYQLQPHYDCGYDATVLKNSCSIMNPNEISAMERLGIEFSAWTWEGCPNIIRSYINFPDLEYILPLVETIDSVFLNLYIRQNDQPEPLPHEIREYCNNYTVAKINEEWDETISWNNQPNVMFETYGFDYIEMPSNPCPCAEENCFYYDNAHINIKPFVKFWQNNIDEIFGLQMKLVTEEIYNGRRYASSHSLNPNAHPMLEIHTPNELRILDPIYYINPGEILVLNGSIDQATYNWDTQNNNGFFTIDQPGFYGLSITLPNCFTFRNEFEIRYKPSIQPFNPVITSINTDNEIEGKPQAESFIKPKGKKSFNFTLFDANGTPIFTTTDVNFDWQEIKNRYAKKTGLYLYKTTEQDLTRHTVITKSGKFYNL